MMMQNILCKQLLKSDQTLLLHSVFVLLAPVWVPKQQQLGQFEGYFGIASDEWKQE